MLTRADHVPGRGSAAGQVQRGRAALAALTLVLAKIACGGDGPGGTTPGPGGRGGAGGVAGTGGVGVGGQDAGGNGTAPAGGGAGNQPGGGGGSVGGAGAGGALAAGGTSGGAGGATGMGGGTAAPDAAGPPAACSVCTSWGAPAKLSQVVASGLDALSGMAASWRNRGVIYVHNDRQNPLVFALGADTGGLLGRITLTGVTAHDIEDIEVSRCPAGTCIFVADIGNNVNPRSEFSIFRAAEPAYSIGSLDENKSVPTERFAFRYSDTPHNAESLVIDPATGAVFIITKVDPGQPSAVYRLETFEVGKMNVATKVADLPVPKPGESPATAATAHPCGAGFLLRTNKQLYEFRIPMGAPFADAFRATPVALPSPVEPQSEAVTYLPDGRSYLTTSEGTRPAINRVLCQ